MAQAVNDLSDLPSWARAEMQRMSDRIAELEDSLPFEGRTLRDLPLHSTYCNGLDYCSCPDRDGKVIQNGTSDLVCSDVGGGMHKPVIDLDLPCRLVESGTPGHFHLYIDKSVPQVAYFELLAALADAGIVERGYVTSSRSRGYSAVRHPDRPKQVRA